MRILQVASEAVPVCKTGGLADVVTALSRALVAGGDDVGVLLPAYRGAIDRTGATLRHELGDPLGTGHPARVWTAPLHDTGATLCLLQCDPLFDRDGGPYGDARYPGNCGGDSSRICCATSEQPAFSIR